MIFNFMNPGDKIYFRFCTQDYKHADNYSSLFNRGEKYIAEVLTKITVQDKDETHIEYKIKWPVFKHSNKYGYKERYIKDYDLKEGSIIIGCAACFQDHKYYISISPTVTNIINTYTEICNYASSDHLVIKGFVEPNWEAYESD